MTATALGKHERRNVLREGDGWVGRTHGHGHGEDGDQSDRTRSCSFCPDKDRLRHRFTTLRVSSGQRKGGERSGSPLSAPPIEIDAMRTLERLALTHPVKSQGSGATVAGPGPRWPASLRQGYGAPPKRLRRREVPRNPSAFRRLTAGPAESLSAGRASTRTLHCCSRCCCRSAR